VKPVYPAGMEGFVFISHSSKDHKPAQAVCAALEGRGLRCWISSRDVGPREIYQEAIAGAIAGASAMVLLFTANAGTCRQLRPGGHLTRVFCAPVLTATRGRSAPVLKNTRQLTRHAPIDDTP
jgi:hypothetical protein